MALEKLISGDSHIVEPPDLWEKRIDPKFRDRAPRLVWTGETDRWYLDKDVPAGPGGGLLTEAGKRYDDPESMSIDSSFEENRQEAFDPHLRLKDMEVDGVVGEVLVPTVTTRFYGRPIDSDLLSACFRAYNDFVADFCKPYPDFFKGLGIINLQNVQEGMEEIDRCLKMGLSGMVIPSIPEEDRTYNLPEYEPLWAMASESGIPLVIHTGTRRPGPGRTGLFAGSAFTQSGNAAFMVNNDHWPRRTIANLIFSGAFERYPGLKIALLEFEMGWVPFFLQQMDLYYSEIRYTQEIKLKGDKVPSDLWYSNVTVNFMEDRVAMKHREMIGVDNITWGSDYPHRESTWPRSREILSELLEGATEEEQTKITYSNSAKLYNFPV